MEFIDYFLILLNFLLGFFRVFVIKDLLYPLTILLVIQVLIDFQCNINKIFYRFLTGQYYKL